MKVTVIGEANIDIAVVRSSETSKGGCLPGRITFHHGGVARNVAHNLCLLGHSVRLMTVFGGDELADRLISDCQKIGMDLSLSRQYKDTKSPVFLSFNDETGDMLSAVSDIALNSKMDMDWVKSRMADLNASEVVVADTWLSADALAYLIDHCSVPLFIDTVSPGRALLLSEALSVSSKRSLFAIKCNLAEATALSGQADPKEAAKALNGMGIEHVYLTMGHQGALHSYNGMMTTIPSFPVQLVNVTGSGDAFLAGVVHAHSLGLSGAHALDYGLKAAQHNIKNEAPVNPTLRISVFEE